jgi:Co/Zn/Cd efflux system component
MADCCDLDEATGLERRALVALLTINATMFVVEAIAGLIAESTGLLADSLDMLTDASVYAAALYAAGRSARIQANAALASGIVQLGLGLSVLIEVGRRYLYGSEPLSAIMMGVGAAALVANLACLILLAKHRQGGVHMRALWICSGSDVIANLGVVASGAMVALLNSRLPDLIVGAVVSALVIRGGFRILGEARAAQAGGSPKCHASE